MGLDGIQLDNSTWTVETSTVHGSNVGAMFIDGNYNSSSVTLNGANEFIEIDMGEVKTFSHFKLFNRLDFLAEQLV